MKAAAKECLRLSGVHRVCDWCIPHHVGNHSIMRIRLTESGGGPRKEIRRNDDKRARRCVSLGRSSIGGVGECSGTAG